MSGYRREDAARDTRSAPKQVTQAWHQARDDSGVRTGGDGDRPTAANRRDAAAKMREVLERSKERERSEQRGRER